MSNSTSELSVNMKAYHYCLYLQQDAALKLFSINDQGRDNLIPTEGHSKMLKKLPQIFVPLPEPDIDFCNDAEHSL